MPSDRGQENPSFLRERLGLDDVFLFHEDIIPIRLGLVEWPFLLAFPVVTLFVLVRCWAVILSTEFLLLGLALGMLGLSLLIDFHSAFSGNMPILGVDHFLAEDGTKFIGTVAWLCYLWRTAASAIFSANFPHRLERRHPGRRGEPGSNGARPRPVRASSHGAPLTAPGGGGQ